MTDWLSTCIYMYISLYPSIYLNLSVCVPVCPSVCLCARWQIHWLSVPESLTAWLTLFIFTIPCDSCLRHQTHWLDFSYQRSALPRLCPLVMILGHHTCVCHTVHSDYQDLMYMIYSQFHKVSNHSIVECGAGTSPSWICGYPKTRTGR